jgi:hypothetical protein
MKSTLVIVAAIIAAAIIPILFPITSPPGGVGGAWRDDHSDNIQAVHCGTVLPERCPDSLLDCVSRARCVLDPNGLLGNSVGRWQDGPRPSRLRSARVSLAFVGALFAHLQAHENVKLATRRPGLADAGSVSSSRIESISVRIGSVGVPRAHFVVASLPSNP